MVWCREAERATFYQAPYAQRCAALRFMVGNDLFNDEKSDTRNVSSLPIYKKRFDISTGLVFNKVDK